jgi:hypothetical protein
VEWKGQFRIRKVESGWPGKRPGVRLIKTKLGDEERKKHKSEREAERWRKED